MSKVIKIGISLVAGDKITEVDSVEAVAGKGLKSDRFYKNDNNKKSQITIIEKENIDDLNKLTNSYIPYQNFRRNIITEGVKLNNLLNKEIMIGNVKLKAHDLCQPCKYLQDILKKENLVKYLLNKGGLRCEILTSGKISVGDVIKY